MYDFKNIFIKKDRHVWSNAQSVQQSIILANVPDNELLHFKGIVRNVLADKDNKLLRNERDIELYLDECVKQGFIVEVHGEKIYKMFKDLLK